MEQDWTGWNMKMKEGQGDEIGEKGEKKTKGIGKKRTEEWRMKGKKKKIKILGRKQFKNKRINMIKKTE